MHCRRAWSLLGSCNCIFLVDFTNVCGENAPSLLRPIRKPSLSEREPLISAASVSEVDLDAVLRLQGPQSDVAHAVPHQVSSKLGIVDGARGWNGFWITLNASFLAVSVLLDAYSYHRWPCRSWQRYPFSLDVTIFFMITIRLILIIKDLILPNIFGQDGILALLAVSDTGDGISTSLSSWCVFEQAFVVAVLSVCRGILVGLLWLFRSSLLALGPRRRCLQAHLGHFILRIVDVICHSWLLRDDSFSTAETGCSSFPSPPLHFNGCLTATGMTSFMTANRI